MNAPLSDSTRLALDRTRLAHERTLMAWVRTAASLISFGFTIYKFFEYVRESGQGTPRSGLIGPRELALIMLAMGVGSLVIATIQHRRDLLALQTQFGAVVPSSLATVTATLMGLLGTALLLSIVFRI
jgi:putative membrane protein